MSHPGARRFWLSCLRPLVYCSQILLNCLAFQYFDFESTWWRLLNLITTFLSKTSLPLFSLYSVPNLPLYLGVLKHRTLLARGGNAASSCQEKNTCDGILLMWCNFKFEGVLFRSNSRHNDRVDSLRECATFRAQVRDLIT